MPTLRYVPTVGEGGEVVKYIAKEAVISEREAYYLIRLLFNYITRKLIQGEEVRFTDFGRFHVVERSSYTTTNLGKEYEVPACRHASFQASSVLKDQIKGRREVENVERFDYKHAPQAVREIKKLEQMLHDVEA